MIPVIYFFTVLRLWTLVRYMTRLIAIKAASVYPRIICARLATISGKVTLLVAAIAYCFSKGAWRSSGTPVATAPVNFDRLTFSSHRLPLHLLFAAHRTIKFHIVYDGVILPTLYSCVLEEKGKKIICLPFVEFYTCHTD